MNLTDNIRPIAPQAKSRLSLVQSTLLATQWGSWLRKLNLNSPQVVGYRWRCLLCAVVNKVVQPKQAARVAASRGCSSAG